MGGDSSRAHHRGAYSLGGLAVLIFSLTLPASKVAIGGLSPSFVAMARAAIAGVLALAYLHRNDCPRPDAASWKRVAVVAACVVFGFPLLTSFALKTVPSAHGGVITGLLPAATAVFAVLRGGERPSWLFWLAALAGLLAVVAFAMTQGGRTLTHGDFMIVLAVALGGLGYAEGAVVARTLGGAPAICWALVLALPFTASWSLALMLRQGVHAALPCWLALGYVSLFSMLLGMFAWYRAMTIGGIARIGQLQLAQPVLTLVWSAWLLHERVTAWTVLAAVAVIACVAITQLSRKGKTPCE